MAVLFDNSASLNANRHFARKAAIKFFRTVLRPKDLVTRRRVIVIISDGADTRSTTPFNEVLRAVQGAHCQVYVLRTGHSDNANSRDLTGEHRLRELTGQTGGVMYTPVGPADLDAAFTSIAADLAAQYILSYYAPGDEEGRALPRD